MKLIGALACLTLCGCASHPSMVRYTYYDAQGCAWIQRPGETATRLVSAATGKPFCLDALKAVR